jgi:cyclophilin family peptidyl-prolyl cis-trans isomerase/protein-disulfide isomerase
MRAGWLIIVLSSLLASCGSAPVGVAGGPTAGLPTPINSPRPACVRVEAEPTPNATVESLFPPVTSSDHVLGPEDAATTVTVYSDFQCVACAQLAAALRQLVDQSNGQVRVVFRPFPLASVNDKSLLAAQAAEAAAEQGKFWQMHDYLFSSQSEWTSLTPDGFRAWLLAQAAPATGLKADQFSADLDRADLVSRVQADWAFGRDTGLPGAPFVFINGQIYTGPRDYDNLSRITGLLALGERQFKSCPTQVIDPSKSYSARLHTDKGDIVIKLFADKAPITVNSFVFLAQQGWFDDITFHRVIPGFVAQTGDPSGTGMGNPGYYIQNEIVQGLNYDREGLVGMANSGPDTNGSQFFITLAPTPHLNGQYTIFGEVTEGMEVVRSLTERDPQPGQSLPPGDRLLSVTIEEK